MSASASSRPVPCRSCATRPATSARGHCSKPSRPFAWFRRHSAETLHTLERRPPVGRRFRVGRRLVVACVVIVAASACSSSSHRAACRRQRPRPALARWQRTRPRRRRHRHLYRPPRRLPSSGRSSPSPQRGSRPRRATSSAAAAARTRAVRRGISAHRQSWAYVDCPCISRRSTVGDSLSADLHGVRFADDTDGYLYGRYLWTTHDGGGHWTRNVARRSAEQLCERRRTRDRHWCRSSRRAGRYAAVHSVQFTLYDSPIVATISSLRSGRSRFGAGPVTARATRRARDE